MNSKLLLVLGLAIAPIFTNAQTAKTDADSAHKKFVKLQESKFTIDPKYVNKLLEQKLNILREDISILILKKAPDLNQVVVNAYRLWNNDNNKTVSVSSAKDHKFKSKKHILEYLNAMKKLPYQDVEIKYGQYSLISKITKGPDGKYHGFVEFTQEFTATTNIENKLGKIDNFAKGKVEVIIEAVDFIDQSGKEKTTYELFLGDMAMEEKR